MARLASVAELTAAIDDVHRVGDRSIVGIVGPPGAGKTHVARFLGEHLTRSGGPRAARVVPMDGFHLRNEALERLGRRDRKGGPDTFDIDGFVAMLDELRAAGSLVRAPAFSRALDEPIDGAIDVEPDVAVVVVEGNYLLVDQKPWAAVGERLDVTFYVDTPADERRRRLLDRHTRTYGSMAAAERWIDTVDDPNTELVESTRWRADHEVADLALPGPLLW